MDYAIPDDGGGPAIDMGMAGRMHGNVGRRPARAGRSADSGDSR